MRKETGRSGGQGVLWPPEVAWLIKRALQEDGAHLDVTSAALVPPDQGGTAVAQAKAAGVLAGIEVFAAVLSRVDPRVKVATVKADGSPVAPDDALARVQGPLRSILAGERVALNFLQHMSGIASETARYVQAVADTRARILDTRKTVPGWRFLDKYAVRMGGGHNHRFNLSDGILIKDNHLAALRSHGKDIAEAVRLAREGAHHGLKVQVEVTSLREAREALLAGADALLLDNMALSEMRRAVALAHGRVPLEASGGITLANVHAVAETGVDFISVGALTHSVKALDMSLEVEVA